MKWVWQDTSFPNFEYDTSLFEEFEQQFYLKSGRIKGSISHLHNEEIEVIRVDLLTQESLSTSSIEGEILKRESVQSSIRKNLGLKTDNRRVQANEAGISELMVNVYLNFDKKLSHKTLYEWHKMLLNGRRDISVIGNYRDHAEPMQIVSGVLSAPKLFYEAPPSENVQNLMANFVNWYNGNFSEKRHLPTLVFAGIIHLWFEIIHPFEDGNGRLGRALVEKAISQNLKSPSLNSFAKIIESRKKLYYDALQTCNHSLKINKWLLFFCEAVLEAQDCTLGLITFTINKNKFFEKYKNTLNSRQYKVVLRIFETGLEGFKGGLSASNYKSITSSSAATATRDLQELIQCGAFYKTGDLKSTRYFLNLETTNTLL